jgi:hypothetical protein
LRFTPERDATALFSQVVTLPGVHMHGPEHHRIVPPCSSRLPQLRRRD